MVNLIFHRRRIHVDDCGLEYSITLHTVEIEGRRRSEEQIKVPHRMGTDEYSITREVQVPEEYFEVDMDRTSVYEDGTMEIVGRRVLDPEWKDSTAVPGRTTKRKYDRGFDPREPTGLRDLLKTDLPQHIDTLRGSGGKVNVAFGECQREKHYRLPDGTWEIEKTPDISGFDPQERDMISAKMNEYATERRAGLNIK